jgi:serpin B
MFVEKKFNLNREFESNANDYFSSKPQKVDFSQNHDLARQEINNWVEGKTNEKIKDLLPSGSVSPNTKIVLVNAIYFKGKWFNQFNADATNKSGQFILNSGESVIHPMMNLEAKLQSAKLGNVAQLIKLPYEGQRLAMYILVPLEDATINEVQEYVTNIEADDLTSVLQAPVLTNLIMPKFKIESTYNLKSTLVSMGLASLFDESKADLTGLNEYEEDKSMFVDDVIQKAFVEVNEEGTEAAAATGLIMKANSFQFPDHYYELNKPFLFYIRDEETGLNLFSGRLMDPRS